MTGAAVCFVWLTVNNYTFVIYLKIGHLVIIIFYVKMHHLTGSFTFCNYTWLLLADCGEAIRPYVLQQRGREPAGRH